jgi:uncharacterized protein
VILDFHCHIGESLYGYKPRRFTPEELLRRMDGAKVDISCCFSFYDVVDNEYVAEAVKPHDRLLAFAFVNPHERDAAERLAELARGGAVRGVKLHPFIHGFHANNTVLLDPIYETCESYNLPILCHGFADNPHNMPSAFGDMAARFPRVNIVMAHGGFMWARKDAVDEASRHENLYLGTTCLLPMGIRDGIEQIGAEKYVFESDAPWGDARPEMMKIEIAAHNDREIEQILWENGARLLGLIG